MQENRNAGLDVVRSMAIIMVLVSHSILLFPEYTSRLWGLEIFGYYGVELFFVLSGFLIGRIILRTFEPHLLGNFGWKKLLSNFWLRRWYRTLPLYYLMLILNIYFWSSSGFGGYFEVRHIDWRHFVFLQNYTPQTVGFFPESWSLAVEEWFYLLFPASIIIVTAFSRPERYNRNIVFFLLSFIVLMMAARFAYVVLQNPSFDFGIRKNIFLRLDAMATGVLLAHLSIYCRNSFSKIAGIQYRYTAMVVLAVTAGWFWQVNWLGWDHSLLARIVMPEVVSAAFALLIAYSYKNINVHRQFFDLTSRVSYSLYLVHFPVFFYLRFWSKPGMLGNTVFMAIKIIAAWLMAYAIAYGLYRWFEQPILHWRPVLAATQEADRKNQ